MLGKGLKLFAFGSFLLLVISGCASPSNVRRSNGYFLSVRDELNRQFDEGEIDRATYDQAWDGLLSQARQEDRLRQQERFWIGALSAASHSLNQYGTDVVTQPTYIDRYKQQRLIDSQIKANEAIADRLK